MVSFPNKFLKINIETIYQEVQMKFITLQLVFLVFAFEVFSQNMNQEITDITKMTSTSALLKKLENALVAEGEIEKLEFIVNFEVYPTNNECIFKLKNSVYMRKQERNESATLLFDMNTIQHIERHVYHGGVRIYASDKHPIKIVHTTREPSNSHNFPKFLIDTYADAQQDQVLAILLRLIEVCQNRQMYIEDYFVKQKKSKKEIFEIALESMLESQAQQFLKDLNSLISEEITLSHWCRITIKSRTGRKQIVSLTYLDFNESAYENGRLYLHTKDYKLQVRHQGPRGDKKYDFIAIRTENRELTKALLDALASSKSCQETPTSKMLQQFSKNDLDRDFSKEHLPELGNFDADNTKKRRVICKKINNVDLRNICSIWLSSSFGCGPILDHDWKQHCKANIGYMKGESYDLSPSKVNEKRRGWCNKIKNSDHRLFCLERSRARIDKSPDKCDQIRDKQWKTLCYSLTTKKYDDSFEGCQIENRDLKNYCLALY